MEGIKQTVGSFHCIDNVNRLKPPSYVTPPPCKTKDYQLKEKDTKNQNNQISPPILNIYKLHGVSTDTTLDRPCCCAPETSVCINHHPERRFVPDPSTILVNQGTYPRYFLDYVQ